MDFGSEICDMLVMKKKEEKQGKQLKVPIKKSLRRFMDRIVINTV